MNHITQYRSALPHQIHPNHCPPLQNFPARFPNPTIPDNVNALMISQMANDGTLQYHNTNLQHFVVENRHLNDTSIKDVQRKQENRNFQPVPMNVERPPEVRSSENCQTNEQTFKPTPTTSNPPQPQQPRYVHCDRGAKNCVQCFKGQQSGKIMVDASTMTDNDEMDQAAGWANAGSQSGNKVAEYLTSLRQFLKVNSIGIKNIYFTFYFV